MGWNKCQPLAKDGIGLNSQVLLNNNSKRRKQLKTKNMITQAFVPIFIPSGNSGPMSEHQEKVILAIWIIVNGLWLISWAITGIRCLKSRREIMNRWEDDDIGLLITFDATMILIWAVLLLYIAGEFLTNFI